jgi:hypothetical protein
MTDSETRYQRLMELVEAEDASNGEVGCGRDLGEQLPVYLRTCGINISDETLRNLLREHLGHVLMERDFDSIVTQVSRFIESKVVQAHTQSERAKLSSTPSEHVAEHIPTENLGSPLSQSWGSFAMMPISSKSFSSRIKSFTRLCFILDTLGQNPSGC